MLNAIVRHNPRLSKGTNDDRKKMCCLQRPKNLEHLLALLGEIRCWANLVDIELEPV
jgi:hypothetical protein